MRMFGSKLQDGEGCRDVPRLISSMLSATAKATLKHASERNRFILKQSAIF